MEFIKSFGIDPVLLIAQIVNFLIVLYLLRRLLYKPILSILEKRKALIKEGLDKTDEARIRLEKVEKTERKILQNAQAQIKKMLQDAKKESQDILENAEKQAKIKTDTMFQLAREQIRLEEKEAEKRLTMQTSRIALDFLQKEIESLFSKKDQEKVMENVIKQFGQKQN